MAMWNVFKARYLVKKLTSNKNAIVSSEQESKLINLGNNVVTPLIKSLKSNDKYTRRRSAEYLGKIPSKKAVEPLIRALCDKDKYVRSNAADALGKIGDSRAIEPLLSILQDPELHVKQSAVYALGTLKSEKAVSSIKHLLTERNAMLKEQIARASSNINSQSAIQTLTSMLVDNDSSVRKTSAQQLEQIGWKPKTEEERIAFHIAKMDWYKLEQVGSASVLPLINCLSDDEAEVRQGAAKVLGKIGDNKALDPLIDTVYKHLNPSSTNAVIALGKLSNAQAVAPLLKVLSDSGDRDLRTEAERALGKLGKEAVPELVIALNSAIPHVRKGAAKALGNIGDISAVKPLLKLLEKKNKDERGDIIESLGNLGDKIVLRPILEILINKDDELPGIRAKAAIALGNLKDNSVTDTLVKALNDGSINVQTAAIIALGKIGDNKAVEPLIDFFKRNQHSSKLSEMWHALEETARALGKLRDPKAIDVLYNYLKGTNRQGLIDKIAGAFAEIDDEKGWDYLKSYNQRRPIKGLDYDYIFNLLRKKGII